MNQRIRSLAAAVAQILALCWVPPGGAAEHTLIHAGYGGIAGYQLPLWVNKEAGISRKYGIELETLLISGGSLNMPELRIRRDPVRVAGRASLVGRHARKSHAPSDHLPA